MRVATIVSALAIVVSAAVFGAILSQQASVAVPATSVAQAAVETPAAAAAVATTDGASLGRQTEPATEAPAAPIVVAQASPKRRAADPAAAPAPAPAPGGPAPSAAAAPAPEPAAPTTA